MMNDGRSRNDASWRRRWYSGDFDDDLVGYKRRKFHWQDERDEVEQEFVAEEEEEGFGVGGGGGGEEESYPVEYDEENSWASSMVLSVKSTHGMPIDRLSSLSDSVLLRVLSFLSPREAARTSVLSRRWQFLWADLPRLEFEESSRQTEKIRKFVARVNRALALRARNQLEKFKVDFNYDKSFASDVNLWVEFVLKNKVKDVDLLLNSGEDFYMLPQNMYFDSSFVRLGLKGCTIAPRGKIDWNSLHTLHLENTELRQDVIKKILKGSPVLHSLNLRGCWGLNRLEIGSPSIRELEIGDWKDGHIRSLLEISAPYVVRITMSVDPKGRMLQLTNTLSPARANIDFKIADSDAGSVKMMRYARELLETLKDVEELELGRGCFKVLSMMVVTGWPLPESTRYFLRVNASSDKQSIPGIVGLLESSPYLEMLDIKGSNDLFEDSASPNLAAASYLMNVDLNCDLLRLKNVQFTSFMDPYLTGEPMLTLAQLLLKGAMELEEMIIDFEEPATSRHASIDHFRIAQTLLSYPRTSPIARILLR